MFKGFCFQLNPNVKYSLKNKYAAIAGGVLLLLFFYYYKM